MGQVMFATPQNYADLNFYKFVENFEHSDPFTDNSQSASTAAPSVSNSPDDASSEQDNSLANNNKGELSYDSLSDYVHVLDYKVKSMEQNFTDDFSTIRTNISHIRSELHDFTNAFANDVSGMQANISNNHQAIEDLNGIANDLTGSVNNHTFQYANDPIKIINDGKTLDWGGKRGITGILKKRHVPYTVKIRVTNAHYACGQPPFSAKSWCTWMMTGVARINATALPSITAVKEMYRFCTTLHTYGGGNHRYSGSAAASGEIQTQPTLETHTKVNDTITVTFDSIKRTVKFLHNDLPLVAGNDGVSFSNLPEGDYVFMAELYKAPDQLSIV